MRMVGSDLRRVCLVIGGGGSRIPSYFGGDRLCYHT